MKVGDILDELKKFRLEMGLTVSNMANEISVSKSFYEKIEMGIRKPSSNFIKKLKFRFPQFDTNIFFEYHIT